MTENIAPGYYSIITRPMDFSTMKTKIHNGDYRSVAEYKVWCTEENYLTVHLLFVFAVVYWYFKHFLCKVEFCHLADTYLQTKQII